MITILFLVVAFLATNVFPSPFDEREVAWNLNTNRRAQNVLQYSGEWEGHNYTASPENWRFPFYSLFLDRFVDGEPENNDINGTVFENDDLSNQMRHGGDLIGLTDSLDYLAGMGIKGIYIAGTPFLNLPWKADQYSPIDFTILDHHGGTLTQWRTAIEEIHSRGMYVLLDITGSTMSDLIGFDGFLNASTPFDPKEHRVQYKTYKKYLDFDFDNTYKDTCDYPRFWDESGKLVVKGSDPEFDKLVGCFDSEFDQYGDTEAFGVFPDWQRQLSKFASVQDRLREWIPSVREKIQHEMCLVIAQLDIDGFRFDKATQMTTDAQAEISASLRTCARKYGKKNFFLPGEITSGNTFGSIYLGRGREPHMVTDNITKALLTTKTDDERFLRPDGLQDLDAAAFHYSVYRALTRFLGMDGNLTAGFDTPTDFVDMWNTMLTTNDFLNANTGEVDPRHMYGASNQDVFRWPAIKDGVDRQMLALFITTLHMPGIPLLLWGEEQAFYVLDSTADNYIFGRQAMSATPAWQLHGCYGLNSSQYYNWPVDAALHGCHDESVSLDHRDPTHPVRNQLRRFYGLREQYPYLNDGLGLLSLSKQTHNIFLPGSNGTATELGMWSTVRTQVDYIQNLRGETSSVWFVYQNEDHQVKYHFDCDDNDKALLAAFPQGTPIKNLLYPYEEIRLQRGPGKKFFVDKSQQANGCLPELTLDPWDFKAFVPTEMWQAPPLMMTKFLPGYDARLPSGKNVDIELRFSENLNCEKVTDSLSFDSTTEDNSVPKIDRSSVECGSMPPSDVPTHGAYIPSVWSWKATLNDVSDGVHVVTVKGLSSDESSTTTTTNIVDHLMFRVGKQDNPIVFPQNANYSRNAYSKDASGDLQVTHAAAGADKWRYSTNWASTWSPWKTYSGGVDTIQELPWSGTDQQDWSGDHVILQYWSKKAGSSAHVQHADANWAGKPPRRFPHIFAQGDFNKFGFDSGLPHTFQQGETPGSSKFHLMTEWGQTRLQLNVWGIDPDGQPDQSFVYGDIDEDNVLDRQLPGSLSPTVINISSTPRSPHLAYRIELDEATLRYNLVPEGSRLVQIIVYALLWSLPILTATLAVWTYMGAFYKIKFNKIGIPKAGFLDKFFKRRAGFESIHDEEKDTRSGLKSLVLPTANSRNSSGGSIAALAERKKRRTILIATMEYDIEDWAIKVKIGGLGVMAQLMGKALSEQDLIWVVPCVGGIEYPVDEVAEPMTVTILGEQYQVQVQYHKLQNITYVLLDAPIFRQQTKAEPYPARMDDLDSAIYYSAWNACIAETIKRFPSIDIYHINDYHGAAAPLYLLPQTIPCCLSLHNAEFQGLWPMRTKHEQAEVCKAFNLSKDVVEKYVQFGEVFNLLHAGASYLRVHQRGFGAVGVSNKYGPRSYARYPIFWGLKEIGKLPNPDPSDTDPWDPVEEAKQVITVDEQYEASRGDLRKQAQEWAGLNVDPNAELFVFVGRWSVQKGVDLIADVFPALLEKHKNVQLIAVGPVIDLHGKFAALKLESIAKQYPGRVFSKPEFTALPPYIFSGAEFALIPSRDEPFGLVAVEFGRKGALGVGARVGGLGQMPGWWYTVESTTSKHLIRQFKSAIEDALGTSPKIRATMRARSAKQRFPVAKWVEDLGTLQKAAIRIHQSDSSKAGRPETLSFPSANTSTDRLSMYEASSSEMEPVTVEGAPQSRSTGIGRQLSLGRRAGPGHHVSSEDNPHLSGVEEGQEDDDEVEISNAEADRAVREQNGALRRLEGLEAAHTRPRRGTFARLRTDDAYTRERAGSDAPDLSILSPGGTESDPVEQQTSARGERTRWRTLSAGNLEERGSLLPGNARQSRSAHRLSSESLLSVNDVTMGRKDYDLQKVELNFTDSTGEYHDKFAAMLQQKLNSKTSESALVIDDYLKSSEKEWAARYREAKLGRSRSPSPTGRDKRYSSQSPSLGSRRSSISDSDGSHTGSVMDEFLLGENYMRPTFLKRWLQTRIFDWPIYSLFLALGQILAANSYQIVLLTDSAFGADETEKLYIIGGIYIIASCLWWILYRTMKPRYVLSIPFVLYGLAFLLVGLSPFIPSDGGRDWSRNVATGLYATASASGSLYFALNFGDEGGAPIKSWVYRALFVQGIQQIYVAALFYWGQVLSGETTSTGMDSMITDKPILAAIACPIAALLLAIAVLLFTSLPPYYRQTPGKIPSFYHSLLRRKLILWMFVSVILQNYFLSAPYGRNWAYLWSSVYAPKWVIFILVAIFFIGVWIGLLTIFARLSKSHSWILPLFAFGLIAPRWAQIWWGTSSYGLWLPWIPGGAIGGAIAGRSLWLWLGVLDMIQGVGIGMALLQTLTRIHVAVALTASQLIGAAVTLIAKATAPDANGPGPVFPDLSAGVVQALEQPWFWVALACQLAIPIGFFVFFRKEQLNKP